MRKESKSDRIVRKLREGVPDRKILCAERITQETLGAYKAGITRQLNAYVSNKNQDLYLTQEDLGRLSTQQRSRLLEIMDDLYDGKKAIKQKVIGLLKSGICKDEVYTHPSLRGVRKESIAAYLAHASRDKY